MSPPGLHITLGIFYRLWCLLEEECHQLDLQLAQQVASSPLDKELFSHYTELLKQLSELEREKPKLIQYTEGLNNAVAHLALHLTNAQSNPLLQALQSEALTASKKLEDMVCYMHIVLYYIL